MTRLLSSNQVFHELNTASRLDDEGTTATTSGAIARGDLVIPVGVGEEAAFTAGDDIRIDVNGDTAFVTSVASTATANQIDVDDPIGRAYASGVTVSKLTAVDLGALTEDGVTINITGGEEIVEAGTQKDIYLFIPTSVQASITWSFRDFAPENIAEILGMDETDANIVHAGGIVAMLSDVSSRSFRPYKFEGLLENGNAVTAYAHAAKVAAVDAQIQLAHGIPAVLPFSGRAVSGFTKQIA